MDAWLKKMEEDYQIDILFACEAGSRAWGTDTSESDYDIRFIYKHRDIRTYLSLKRIREVIDINEPYDAHGWDIFKAFHLIRKSNPSIYEWSFSPIIYKNTFQFSERLKEIVEKEYSPFSLFHHYIQLMSRNMKDVIKKDSIMNDKRQKQLIQAVRAFLIARYIAESKSVSSECLFHNFCIPGDHVSAYYRQLVHAKKTFSLISDQTAKDILNLLEAEKESITGQAGTLPKGGDSTLELNNWLWNLLEI